MATAQTKALELLRSAASTWEHWVKLAKEMGEHAAPYMQAMEYARKQWMAEVMIGLEGMLQPQGYDWAFAGGGFNERLTVQLKARTRTVVDGSPAAEASLTKAKAQIKEAVKAHTGQEMESVGVDTAPQVQEGGTGGGDHQPPGGGGGGGDREPPPPSGGDGPPSSRGPRSPESQRIAEATERLHVIKPDLTVAPTGKVNVHGQLDIHVDDLLFIHAKSADDFAAILEAAEKLASLAPGAAPDAALFNKVKKLSTAYRVKFTWQLTVEVHAELVRLGVAGEPMFQDMDPASATRVWDIVSENRNLPGNTKARAAWEKQDKQAAAYGVATAKTPAGFVDQFQLYNSIVDAKGKAIRSQFEAFKATIPEGTNPKPAIDEWCARNGLPATNGSNAEIEAAIWEKVLAEPNLRDEVNTTRAKNLADLGLQVNAQGDIVPLEGATPRIGAKGIGAFDRPDAELIAAVRGGGEMQFKSGSSAAYHPEKGGHWDGLPPSHKRSGGTNKVSDYLASAQQTIQSGDGTVNVNQDGSKSVLFKKAYSEGGETFTLQAIVNVTRDGDAALVTYFRIDPR